MDPRIVNPQPGRGFDAGHPCHDRAVHPVNRRRRQDRQGLFLFDYFVADDPAVALQLWEHLAGWFVGATGLENSTVLEPIGDSHYVFVNHGRWDIGLAQFMLRTFAKPSFRRFVVTSQWVDRTGAMPILYRLG